MQPISSSIEIAPNKIPILEFLNVNVSVLLYFVWELSEVSLHFLRL